MKCGRGLLGWLLCRHKGPGGECTKLGLCDYAESEQWP